MHLLQGELAVTKTSWDGFFHRKKWWSEPAIGVFILAAVTVLAVGWYCFKYQLEIERFAAANGFAGFEISRLSIEADADTVANHAISATRFAEGQWLPSNNHVYEHRDRVVPYPYLNRCLGGLFYILVGRDIDKALNGLIIIGPMAAAASIFILVYVVTKSGFFAMAFSLACTILARWPANIMNDLSEIIQGDRSNLARTVGYLFNKEWMDDVMFISRLEAPALTYWLYGLAFLVLFWADRNLKLHTWIAAGLAVGLLTAVSPFHFLYAAIFAGLLLINWCFNERIRGLQRIGWFVPGLILGLSPFLILLWQGTQASWYADLQSRVHLEMGRLWRSSHNAEFLISFVLAGVSLILYRIAHFEGRRLFLWAACLFFVRPIYFNLQLIFGAIPEPDHIERYGTNLGEWLGVAWLTYGLLCLLREKGLAKMSYALYIVPMVFLAAVINWIQVAPAQRASRVWKTFVRPPEETALLNWIQSHTERNAVFLTLNFPLAMRMSTVTHRFLYVSPPNNVLTNDEIMNRFIRACRILSVGEEQFMSLLRENRYRVFLLGSFDLPRYIDSSFNASMKDRKLPEAMYQAWEAEYRNLANQSHRLSNLAGGLKLDYLLITPFDRKALGTIRMESKFGPALFISKSYAVYPFSLLSESTKALHTCHTAQNAVAGLGRTRSGVSHHHSHL